MLIIKHSSMHPYINNNSALNSVTLSSEQICFHCKVEFHWLTLIMINHLFMCLHKLVAAVHLEIKAIKDVWYHSIAVGGGALSGVWWPLTWPQALFQAEGLGVEPISISSTASIQELCTDPFHSVIEPFSLIASARHSGIIVKSARICKVVNGNMQHQRDNSNHQRKRLC